MSTVDELVAKCKKERNEQLGATLVQRLKNRGFDAWYCATKDEALQQALALIPKWRNRAAAVLPGALQGH